MSPKLAGILLQHFTTTFLRGLLARDETVLEALSRAKCLPEDGGVSRGLTVSLAVLFDALYISAELHGMIVHSSDWGREFRQFCKLLMYPWPDSTITSVGYCVRPVRRGNSHATTVIALLPNK